LAGFLRTCRNPAIFQGIFWTFRLEKRRAGFDSGAWLMEIINPRLKVLGLRSKTERAQRKNDGYSVPGSAIKIIVRGRIVEHIGFR
jgi:hypothetical protein